MRISDWSSDVCSSDLRGGVDPTAAGPKARAAHFVGVGLAGDFIRKVGYAARMQRRTPAREARHRQIEAAPEEVYGAHLADVARTELLEHAIDLVQHSPEALCVLRVVGGVLPILAERDWVRHLVRTLVDSNRYSECIQCPKEFVVEQIGRASCRERVCQYV